MPAYEKSDELKQAESLLRQHEANQPGAYQSQYQDRLNSLLTQIQNREDFQYDVTGDALFQYYKDRYVQNGQKAMQDTIGQAAALTGGYGSSYAQSVGQQAYNSYMQQLGDVVPELYQLAWDKHNRETSDLQRQYVLYSDLEARDYSRWQDEQNAYNTQLQRLTADVRNKTAQDWDRYISECQTAYDEYQQEFNNDMNAADIGDFLYDSQAFVEQSANDYSALTWEQGTSEEYTAKRKEASEALTARADQVRSYLNANKSYLDPEFYEEYMQYIDDFLAYQLDSADAFQAKMDGMKQFNNREEYEKAVQEYEKNREYYDKYTGMTVNQLTARAASLPDGEEKNWVLAYAAGTPKTLEELRQDLVWTRGQYEHLIQMQNKSAEIAELKNLLNAKSPDSPGYAELEKQYEDMLKQYPSMDIFEDLDGQITAVEAKLWDLERKVKYQSLSDNQDFAELSKSTDIFAQAFSIMETFGILGIDKVQYLKKDELATFNYINAKEGKSAAKEYLNYLEYDLDKRRQAAIAEEHRELATEHPFWADIKSVGATLTSGVGLVDIARQNTEKWLHEAFTGEYAGPINYYSPAMTPNTIATSIRSTRAQNIANKYGVIDIDPEEHPHLAKIFNGKGLADVYQLGMSMVDSTAVLALTPILGPYSAVLLGGSAGTQGVLNAVENGATDGQALAMGVLNGFFEMFFEKYSLETLLNSGSRSFIDAVWRQAVTEGTEEFFTSAANNVADILIMAEKSGYMKNVAAYIAAGYSESEAMQNALLDMGIDMGWDFVGGMISGSIMGSGGKVVSNVVSNSLQQLQNYQSGKNILSTNGGVDALLNSADQVRSVSSADMQNKLTAQIDKVNQNANARNIGQLNATVQATNNQVNQAAVAESLKGTGIPAHKIDTLAEAIVGRVNGQKLTRTQRDVLRFELGRPVVQRVINDLIQKKSNGIDNAQNNVYDTSGIGNRLSNEEKSASLSNSTLEEPSTAQRWELTSNADGSSSYQAQNMSSQANDDSDINSGTVLGNGQTIDDMAEIYAEKVNANRRWRWADAFPNARKLSKADKTSIKRHAIEKGLIPDVLVKTVKGSGKKTYRYVDFEAAGLVKEKMRLPEKLWGATDKVQFKWLDEQIGGRPKGYTWHHSEKDGQMELVPTGIHRIYHHNGGRTINHWAYRKGGR